MIKQLINEFQTNVSLEEHRVQLSKTKEISIESLMPFLKEFGNKSLNLLRDTFPSLKERNFKEAVKNGRELRSIVREKDNIELSNIVIIVPERFDGNIPSYIKDLIISYDTVSEDIKELFEMVNFDIGLCINNSGDTTIHEVKSIILAKKLTHKRESLVKKLSSYFPVNKATSHTTFLECFRSSSEFSKSYEDLNTLEKTINKFTLNDIEKISSTTIELVNSYVSLVENNKNGLEQKNTRDLIESIYELAKSLEFCGYLHANINSLYNTYVTMKID